MGNVESLSPKLRKFLAKKKVTESFLSNAHKEYLAKVEDTHDTISSAFIWSGSKEGNYFWSQLNTEFNGKIGGATVSGDYQFVKKPKGFKLGCKRFELRDVLGLIETLKANKSFCTGEYFAFEYITSDNNKIRFIPADEDEESYFKLDGNYNFYMSDVNMLLRMYHLKKVTL